MFCHEVCRKRDNVVSTRTKWWHLNLQAAQSIEKIGSKSSLFNELSQALVSGHKNARVDGSCRVASDAFDGELLDGAKELRLGRGLEVGDLVEEQRAIRCKLELPPAALHAGGRSVFDSE